MTFGDRLKEIRKNRGKSTKEVAEYIGKSDRLYRFYESGDRDPGTKDIFNICKYLNVSADYLLGTTFQKNDTDTIDMNSARRDRYNKLDTYGKKAVDSLIDIEHERITGFDLPKSKTVRIMFTKVGFGDERQLFDIFKRFDIRRFYPCLVVLFLVKGYVFVSIRHDFLQAL